MPPPESLQERRAEFDAFVWIHTDDAFQQQFDTATDVPPEVRNEILNLLVAIDQGDEEEALATRIAAAYDRCGLPFLEKLIQLVGLTRNKLKSDVDAIGRAARVPEASPSSWDRLPARPRHWELARRELAARLRAVFGPASGLNPESLSSLLETVNRATWPGYIRQERAKRSGHQAEARLARICRSLGIAFEPAAKAEQDIAADIQVAGISFDLVFPSSESPRLCVISTVHTANIGQYGESKDSGDIRAARAALARLEPPPKLLALADGLGFRSNIAGLNGILSTADEFCQFRTLWKGAVVAAHETGTSVKLWIPDRGPFDSFLSRHADAITILSDRPDHAVEAGDGYLLPD